MLTRHLFLAVAGLSVLAAPPAFAAGKPGNEKPNALTKAEKKAGWRLLFDGKSTKGWRGYKKTEVPASWKVVKGVLTLDGKGGDLMTEEQFGDFELSIDWKIAPGGNSGLMYRVAEIDGPPYMTGPEYQLLDDAGHPDANAGHNGDHKAGALYDVYPPAKAVVLPAGQWNRTKIVLQGNHVEHWLNGEKVVEAELGSADWNTRVAASKWKKAAQYGKIAKGHIDLQDHGDKIEFRSIKVRVIEAAAAAAPAAAAPAAKPAAP
jgi:Domain of Unknown Function (DUF1080)